MAPVNWLQGAALPARWTTGRQRGGSSGA